MKDTHLPDETNTFEITFISIMLFILDTFIILYVENKFYIHECYSYYVYMYIYTTHI